MAAEEHVLRLTEVSKSYAGRRVVDRVSFSQHRGTILGLVGPNGAGKTTLIRIVMGIVTPEAGAVQVLGVPCAVRARERVGYLPEERGLYQKQTVRQVLRYLAKLKGIGRHRSDRRMGVWLERLGVPEALEMTVRELSKGMQQKVQFVATVLHDPDLLLLDEPFAGLDPVSRQELRAILQELAASGKTILLSSHEMAEVEMLCPQVVMLNLGQVVLSGAVDAIKAEQGDHAVFVRGDGEWSALGGVERVEPQADGSKIYLAADCQPADFLRQACAAGAAIEHFQIARPSLEEVFVQVARADGRGAPAA
jgi:ABC-2 type transport system ATP-binding protein